MFNVHYKEISSYGHLCFYVYKDSMKLLNLSAEGADKILIDSQKISCGNFSNYIIKIFKSNIDPLNIEDQMSLIALKENYFGNYLAKTFICESLENKKNYLLIQEKVRGNILKNLSINNLTKNDLNSISEIISQSIKILLVENYPIDFWGCQGKIKNQNKENLTTIIKTRLHKFSFLSSTNLMKDENYGIKVVDIADSSSGLNGLSNLKKSFLLLFLVSNKLQVTLLKFLLIIKSSRKKPTPPLSPSVDLSAQQRPQISVQQ